jgi:hypothetical protein
MLAAALLGAGIGQLEVFKETALGTHKLHAAELASLLGYGGALAILVLVARRAAAQLRRSGSELAHLAFILPPLAALVVLSAGYRVLLAVLEPFLSSGQRNFYSWAIVLGISAAAIWLVVALYWHSEGFAALLRRPRQALDAHGCRACGAGVPEQAKFCPACGQPAGV